VHPQGNQGNYQFQAGPAGGPPFGVGAPGYTDTVARSEQSFLTKVYGWMCLGLLITFGLAFGLQDAGLQLANYWIFFAIAQIGIALVMGFAFNKLSPGVMTILYLGYAAITGLTFAAIFKMLEVQGLDAAIAPAFLSTAGTFGLMSLIGYVTKMDLSRWGSFLLWGLVGVLVGGLVGIFFSATLYTWVFIYGGLIVFMGLTIYETWLLKNSAEEAKKLGPAGERKFAVYGAFSLYLNFINIFLRMLYIFSGSRN